LVYIDDIHDKHFVSDVVINHAAGIQKESYSVAPYTCLLLGTNYALLRPEFLNYDKRKEGSSLLVCLGGSDRKNGSCSTKYAIK
jgi:spore coat polysaccharide biosynthesis predicted glycosyltransferase SpsG